MPITSRFNLAFAEWMRSDLDRFNQLWALPEYGSAEVKLPLRRFEPHLAAYLGRNGVNVAVEWDYEVWDLLCADDLSAERGPSGGWRCGLCPDDQAKEHATIERLWAEHLFEPLADWIERVLMPATGLYLCRYGGASWAVLKNDATLPRNARYAVFATETEE